MHSGEYRGWWWFGWIAGFYRQEEQEGELWQMRAWLAFPAWNPLVSRKEEKQSSLTHENKNISYCLGWSLRLWNAPLCWGSMQMFSLFSIICIIKQKLLPMLKLSQSTESKILFCLLTLHTKLSCDKEYSDWVASKSNCIGIYGVMLHLSSQ